MLDSMFNLSYSACALIVFGSTTALPTAPLGCRSPPFGHPSPPFALGLILHHLPALLPALALDLQINQVELNLLTLFGGRSPGRAYSPPVRLPLHLSRKT